MIRYAITAGGQAPFLKRDPEPRICGCANPASCTDPSRMFVPGILPFPPDLSLLRQVRHLAHQGIDYIQLREKHLPAGDLATLARKILVILSEAASPARLLINSRADVAAATGAHGVHLPSEPDALTPSQVRRLFRSVGLPSPIVSQSCHTRTQLRAAHADPPDFILFSPVFGKSVAGVAVIPAAGLDALATACTLAYPIAVLALGGVTPANACACLQAGAAGVAGVSLFQADSRV